MGRQYRQSIGLVLMLLSAVAVAAAAQEQPAPRPPRDLEREFREQSFRWDFGPGQFQYAARRGRLGILVDLTPDAARDTLGARVAGVTPGGPADRAGVRTDDIVVRVNGTRLVTAAADRGETPAESRPGMRLIEIGSRFDPGDTVRLDLRRDNRPLTVTFQAGESDADVIVRRFGDNFSLAVPRLQEGLRGLVEVMPRVEGQTGRVMIRIGGPLADLELVKVNPGLAEYFGTSEGLLVVDAPSDSSLGLRAGDVILSIGGRRPTSPAHAMRILGTYDAGENVSFEVMRQKRRVTVNGRMPTEERRWRSIRNSFEIPVPPPDLPHATDRVPHSGGVVRIVMEEA